MTNSLFLSKVNARNSSHLLSCDHAFTDTIVSYRILFLLNCTSRNLIQSSWAWANTGDSHYLQILYLETCLHFKHSITSPHFLVCVIFLGVGVGVISLFKRAPKYGAKGLSGISNCKKVGMWLMEKIYVLDKLCSVVSFMLLTMSSVLMNQQ